jgi:MFS family permease
VKTEKRSEEKTQQSLRPLYARSVVNSLGGGMVNPFLSAYAVKLGASTSLMGWLQSSTNISSNLMQIFWGRISDALRRRIPFIVFGGVFLSALWIPMDFVADATQLMIILVIQALVGSMATPTWTALIGDLVPSHKLGRVNASISLCASIGSLITTLASGVLMISVQGTIQQVFLVPLVVAMVSGIVSSLIMLKIEEKKNGEKMRLRENLTSDIFDVLSCARKTKSFVKYCYADATFQFFMSISWPLFSITQVKILNASMLQIAVLSVVQTIITIAFQGWAGRLADTVGRKPLLVFFRFSLVTVPLAYAFVPDLNVLTAIGLFWGLSQALGSASQTAYLLEATPKEHRGSFTAIYNLTIGVVTFFGSLIGGYFSDYTISVFGLITGLQIVYSVSIVGRTIGAGLQFTLDETLKK